MQRDVFAAPSHVDGAVNDAGIQKDLDFFLKQGWVTGQIKASDVIDMSFAQKASSQARLLSAGVAVTRFLIPVCQRIKMSRKLAGLPSCKAR